MNRQCSSGLQAVADVAAAIKAGFYDIGKSDWSDVDFLCRDFPLAYDHISVPSLPCLLM